MRFTRFPVKENVMADSVMTTTPSIHIHKILSILNVLSSYATNDRKFVGKMYIEGAFMSKSCTTVLMLCEYYSVELI